MFSAFFGVSKVLDSRFECVCSKVSAIVRVSCVFRLWYLVIAYSKIALQARININFIQNTNLEVFEKKCLANMGLKIVQISACKYTVLNTYFPAYYCLW